MKCVYCNDSIDPDRYDFLVESNRTIVCVGCSSEDRAVGFMSFSHKTAPELVLCPSGRKEAIRLMSRANRRAR